MEDIQQFGVLALEIALAQKLTTEKIKKIIKRIYESRNFDKKYIEKLCKYINDDDYRSLIETCIRGDKNITCRSILSHKFFTVTRDKSETMAGIIMRPKSKLFNLKLSETNKTAKRSSAKELSIALIIWNRNSIIQVKFKYDVNYDTPEGIARELQDAFGFPEQYSSIVKEQIKEKILCKNLIRKEYFDNDHFNKTMKSRRQSSISESISAIDSCSTTSICTTNTVMENLKVMSDLNFPICIPKIPLCHEEFLQPDISYSDVQTPRYEYEDDMTPKYKRLNEEIRIPKEHAEIKPIEVMETEDDKKNKPII